MVNLFQISDVPTTNGLHFAQIQNVQNPLCRTLDYKLFQHSDPIWCPVDYPVAQKRARRAKKSSFPHNMGFPIPFTTFRNTHPYVCIYKISTAHARAH